MTHANPTTSFLNIFTMIQIAIWADIYLYVNIALFDKKTLYKVLNYNAYVCL